jgi:gliding motility-associated-like protein
MNQSSSGQVIEPVAIQENTKRHPMKKIILLRFILLFTILLDLWNLPFPSRVDAGNSACAQTIVNNGANVFSTAGAWIYVGGDVINQSGGTFDHSGIIDLYGNWENNAGNTAFINSSPGKVKLWSGSQFIRGTDVTNFYDLILLGTGIKALDSVSTVVEDSLVLNHLELAADTNTVFVTSTDTGMITRTTGFVSALMNGGLSRSTSYMNNYLFPVGSSNGTLRYRPVIMKPASSGANAYKVRMANVDATSEAFDRMVKDTSLCTINPYFYHRIWHTAGNTPANIAIYYDNAADGSYSKIGHWQNVPRWESTGAVAQALNASPALSSITKSSWNDFTYPAFALATPSPVLTLSSPPSVCSGQSVTITAAGTGSFSWSTGDTTASIDVTPSSATTYSVTLTDSTGCSSTSSVLITVNLLPMVDITGTDTLCAGQSTALSVSGAGAYSWSTGAATSSIIVSPQVTTPYGIMLTDSNGCSANDTLTVTVIPAVSTLIAGNTSVCPGGSIVLSASGNGSFVWSTGDTTSSVTVTPAGNTAYSVTLTNAQGCSGTDTISVTIGSSPFITVTGGGTIIAGSSTALNASGGTTYIWSPAAGLSCTSCPDPVASPAGSTTYCVAATDTNGCTVTECIAVSVETPCGEVFVPTAFSPNNDGMNDVECVLSPCISEIHFVIYDRWGEKVFESYSTAICWDGTYKGKLMNSAVFVYYLEATLITGEKITKKGDISLVR